jgi:hypothetical protein
MNKLIIASAILLLAALCQANPVEQQSSTVSDGLFSTLSEIEARHIGHHHNHHYHKHDR